MTEHDAAVVLADLGATLELDAGDMITDAVIVCRVARPAEDSEGSSRVVMGCTAGTEWLDQFALIKAADNILSFAAWREDQSGEEGSPDGV